MIAHVSAIFLLPVLEKSVIFNDFRAIAHSISARVGCNTVCCNAMVQNRTDDDSVTYWFPWKHPMARRRGLEFGVFDQTPPKTGSSARLGSALRASPLDLFSSTKLPQANHRLGLWGFAIRLFRRLCTKTQPKCGLGLRVSPFERWKCTRRHFFALLMSGSRSWTCCTQLRPRWVFY